jgi:hypothetical protein
MLLAITTFVRSKSETLRSPSSAYLPRTQAVGQSSDKSKGLCRLEKHYGDWQRYSMVHEGVAVRFSVTAPDP